MKHVYHRFVVLIKFHSPKRLDLKHQCRVFDGTEASSEMLLMLVKNKVIHKLGWGSDEANSTIYDLDLSQ